MDDKEHSLEYKIGNNVYRFVCGKESPIHEVSEALHAFQGHLLGILKQHFAPAPKVDVIESAKEESNG
jgi:hypothetical protein